MKLKNINFGLGLVALLALSSCADDKFSEYRTDMTKNLKEYQYLNNYEPLKKYVEDMKLLASAIPTLSWVLHWLRPTSTNRSLYIAWLVATSRR